MFHSFSYPEESGKEELHSRFWFAAMVDGRIVFPRPEECTVTKFVRTMKPTNFRPGISFSGLGEEGLL